MAAPERGPPASARGASSRAPPRCRPPRPQPAATRLCTSWNGRRITAVITPFSIACCESGAVSWPRPSLSQSSSQRGSGACATRSRESIQTSFVKAARNSASRSNRARRRVARSVRQVLAALPGRYCIEQNLRLHGHTPFRCSLAEGPKPDVRSDRYWARKGPSPRPEPALFPGPATHAPPGACAPAID